VFPNRPAPAELPRLCLGQCRGLQGGRNRRGGDGACAYKTLKESCRVILQGALRANGLPDTSYELNAAVRAVLDTDHAEKRWLRGEDIFAQVPQVSPNNAQAEKLIAFVAANIAPTL
jgi:hypothetical protein